MTLRISSNSNVCKRHIKPGSGWRKLSIQHPAMFKRTSSLRPGEMASPSGGLNILRAIAFERMLRLTASRKPLSCKQCL